MPDPTFHVGVLTLELYFPAPNSLKSKRSILKSLIDRIRSRFNVSISELEEQDKWQKSVCGISMIASDKSFLDSRMRMIVDFVESQKEIEIVDYELIFA